MLWQWLLAVVAVVADVSRAKYTVSAILPYRLNFFYRRVELAVVADSPFSNANRCDVPSAFASLVGSLSTTATRSPGDAGQTLDQNCITL